MYCSAIVYIASLCEDDHTCMTHTDSGFFRVHTYIHTYIHVVQLLHVNKFGILCVYVSVSLLVWCGARNQIYCTMY